MKLKTVARKVIEYNFLLKNESITGKEVVVTAQAKGQTEAINQQLSSKNIIDVVSSARIQELPDANAAESVGRLPGVSVLRSGGEGNKIVIRGMAPKYNNIEVAGVKMSSTDSDDRSVDLSMISPYMLDGIEVTKAVTPDMDADAIGGTVNFKLKEAPEGTKYDFIAQGGYNDLKKEYNNFKVVGSASNRFLDNRLGIFGQIDIEGKNNSSNNESASYDEKGTELTNVKTIISSMALNDYERYLNRYGGTLVLDYKIPEGSIILNNFYSSSKKKTWTRGQSFDLIGPDHYYTAGYSEVNLTVLTNSLRYTQNLPLFKVDAIVTHSFSGQDVPQDYSFDFEEVHAFKDYDPTTIAPSQVQQYTYNNMLNTSLYDVGQYSWNLKDREITGALNISKEFNVLDELVGTIKGGGKYGYKDRSYDYTSYTGVLNSGSGQMARDAILKAYPWMQNQVALGSQYLLYPLFIGNYDMGNFLNGEYSTWPTANLGLMSDILNILKGFNSSEAYHRNDFSSNFNSYNGNEYYAAGYIMADFEFSNTISFITGIRYEQLEHRYTAPRGNSTIGLPTYTYQHTDTTTDATDKNWMPMAQIKYKPFDWLDVRFAYTNTLSRPDFTELTPLYNIGSSTVTDNNYLLKPVRSENYDLQLSVHNNTLGLFTFGVFKKKIRDMIVPTDNKVVLNPAQYGLNANTQLYFATDLNDPFPVDLWGIEANWETHFWYLPGLLNGLVFDINYTHTHSEAKYERTMLNRTFNFKTGKYTQTEVDTFYTARMIDQPDNIINLSLGYDYEGFSARVSFVYQSDIFIAANFWPQLRINTADYRRWDLSVKQKLPWYGIETYLNIINIGNAEDRNIYSATSYPSSEQYYGMVVNLGIRYRLE
jgi:TonB-dependent receptor